jgi:hypothetical protein
MALKIVGSGLGRTGTLSLKLALEQLGFGPCHHMMEVFRRPETIPLWVEAGQGRPDWEAIFAGFQAMVDYPGSLFWRQLIDHYPDAKVIHSTRDADQWFDSTQSTILAPGSLAENPPEHLRAFFEMLTGDFDGRIHDRAHMTARFRAHEAEVLATAPKERLLVFHVGSGWAPLCAFLGVPIPDAPYPSENSREAFQQRVANLPRP